MTLVGIGSRSQLLLGLHLIILSTDCSVTDRKVVKCVLHKMSKLSFSYRSSDDIENRILFILSNKIVSNHHIPDGNKKFELLQRSLFATQSECKSMKWILQSHATIGVQMGVTMHDI